MTEFGYSVAGLTRDEIGDVERMVKAMIKFLENKHLNPELLGPFLPTKLDDA
jgi:hypothetical protein